MGINLFEEIQGRFFSIVSFLTMVCPAASFFQFTRETSHAHMNHRKLRGKLEWLISKFLNEEEQKFHRHLCSSPPRDCVHGCSLFHLFHSCPHTQALLSDCNSKIGIHCSKKGHLIASFLGGVSAGTDTIWHEHCEPGHQPENVQRQLSCKGNHIFFRMQEGNRQ